MIFDGLTGVYRLEEEKRLSSIATGKYAFLRKVSDGSIEGDEKKQGFEASAKVSYKKKSRIWTKLSELCGLGIPEGFFTKL